LLKTLNRESGSQSVWDMSLVKQYTPYTTHTLKYNINQNQTTKLNPKMFKYGYK